MNKKTFLRKVAALEKIQEQLAEVVWPIFGRYIKEKGINFNGPERFEVYSESVSFEGTDGCRGCYDPKSVSIPLRYFFDFDGEIVKDREEERVKFEKRQKQKIAEQTQAELTLLETLKKKYEKV